MVVAKFAGEVAAFLLLGGDEAGGEALHFAAGDFSLLVAKLGFVFEAADAADGDGRQDKAKEQRGEGDGNDAAAEAGLDGADAFLRGRRDRARSWP
ncbi:MAG: hypothetical protein QM757_18510 [Paludibaculum sp.]